MVLGAFIQGLKVEGRVFAGGPFDFLTPFSILTGIALAFGYGLLGAGWLVLKTEDDIQARAPLWPRLPGGCGDRDRGGESMDAADERCSL
jgi:cytochrome bd-type quinol oxidase subunit 2